MMLVLIKIKILAPPIEIIVVNFSKMLRSVILNQKDENMIIAIHSLN